MQTLKINKRKRLVFSPAMIVKWGVGIIKLFKIFFIKTEEDEASKKKQQLKLIVNSTLHLFSKINKPLTS
jgi:hypothetical protein